jgi:hypothetical protein
LSPGKALAAATSNHAEEYELDENRRKVAIPKYKPPTPVRMLYWLVLSLELLPLFSQDATINQKLTRYNMRIGSETNQRRLHPNEVEASVENEL